MQLKKKSDAFHPWLTEISPQMAIDRRRLLTISAVAGTAAVGARIAPGTSLSTAAQQEPASALSSGHTWFLETADALRPQAPAAPTAAELDELLAFQADRTEEMIETINRWAGQQAVLPWLELGGELSDQYSPSALMDIRAQALLTTAMNDAVLAVLDAQNAVARPNPADSDDRITPIESPFPSASSFPSLHATVAGAASTVLAYLFPEGSTDGFAELANEAAISRQWAGANYRSDVEAGLALGQTIGQLAVEHGQADGTDTEWDGEGWPEGDGLYQRTPPANADPYAPHAGTWTTWVLPSGDAIRPAPYPEYASPAWNAELATIQRLTEQRTLEQERTIDYWLNQGPKGFYTTYAKDILGREQLGEAESSLLLSTLSVAMFDALVAVWDAKYFYWTARPSTMDPELNLYEPNPPYPSYPGGFASVCASGAGVLADFFPAYADDVLAMAQEGAMIRAWMGIHYVLDNEVGLQIGGRTARSAVDMVRGEP